MLKVALVGCGKIADGHVEEIQKMPEKASVVAVCDRELLMAEQLAARYGIPAHYDNFEQMLERAKPDVVHITTPPQSHLPLGTAAVAAGCHVLVEKPLTPSYAESRQLVELVSSAGRKLTIGYTYYFDPVALRMRELIAAGALGEPVHVEALYGYNLEGPFGAAVLGDMSHWVHALPGKLIHNNIDHLLYRVAELIPDERPCIRAIGMARRGKRYGDQRDELLDEARILLQGERATACCIFSSHIRPVQQLARVYGTRATLNVDYTGQTVTVETASTLPGAFGRLASGFRQSQQYWQQGIRNLLRFARSDFHYFAGLNRLIALFYDSIANDSEPPIPYREILRIAAMMDEIFCQLGREGAT